MAPPPKYWTCVDCDCSWSDRFKTPCPECGSSKVLDDVLEENEEYDQELQNLIDSCNEV